MKKNLFKIAFCVAVLATSLSSCTKEQTSLNLLKGTWNLDAMYDSDGVLMTPSSMITSQVTEVTFFDCNAKENESCTGVTKVTTDYVSSDELSYSVSEFSYEVFEKDFLILGSTTYEIEELTKKSLVIHPASSPKAKREYSK